MLFFGGVSNKTPTCPRETMKPNGDGSKVSNRKKKNKKRRLEQFKVADGDLFSAVPPVSILEVRGGTRD